MLYASVYRKWLKYKAYEGAAFGKTDKKADVTGIDDR